ncbi:MAG: HAMP domain-containing sensor histidine kinase, partial [Proteobacteria bacterium]|nr:HAMP domain-containing sensor histidine kinase [Pseudomonadota bacterium]
VAERTRELMDEVEERKRMEVDLRQAKEAAEYSNRAKGEFLANMSHELRTPLNSILGFAQLLDDNPREPLSPDQAESLKYILRGGEHLLELINQVLDLSKIESGTLELLFEPVALEDVVDECLQIIKPLSDDRNIALNYIAPKTEPPSFWTDRGRLRQILLNLLMNAVKYNRDGGRVTVSAEEATGDFWRIKVNDTGIGIPKDDWDKVFLPFDRLGRESREIEGTGIGLAITKQIMEQMEGEVGFDSQEGIGSTFWIDLPTSAKDATP